MAIVVQGREDAEEEEQRVRDGSGGFRGSTAAGGVFCLPRNITMFVEPPASPPNGFLLPALVLPPRRELLVESVVHYYYYYYYYYTLNTFYLRLYGVGHMVMNN